MRLIFNFEKTQKLKVNEEWMQILNAKEAATVLRISTPYLYQLIADRKGFPVHAVGNRKLFIKEELERWLQNQPSPKEEKKK